MSEQNGDENDLKIFDTLHDFGTESSNRSAQEGINQLGITVPIITQQHKAGWESTLHPKCCNSQRLYRA